MMMKTNVMLFAIGPNPVQVVDIIHRIGEKSLKECVDIKNIVQGGRPIECFNKAVPLYKSRVIMRALIEAKAEAEIIGG